MKKTKRYEMPLLLKGGHVVTFAELQKIQRGLPKGYALRSGINPKGKPFVYATKAKRKPLRMI